MDYAEIIKTDIVDESWNVFWEEADEHIKGMDKRDMLVLASPYQQGSSEETLLLKMLQASKLAPAQYNIVQVPAAKQIAWHKIRALISPKQVFMVGIMPAQLGISAFFRLNEPNHFNECTFIPTLSLAELEKQPEMRKQLWEQGLKPVFIG